MELFPCSVFLPIDKPGTNDSWFILQQTCCGMWVINVSSCDRSLPGCAGQRALACVDSSSPRTYLNLTATLDCTGLFGFKIFFFFKRPFHYLCWVIWGNQPEHTVDGGLMCSSSCSRGLRCGSSSGSCRVSLCRILSSISTHASLKVGHSSQSSWSSIILDTFCLREDLSASHTVDGDVPFSSMSVTLHWA